MKVAVFSTKPYDERYLRDANKAFKHDLAFFEARLSQQTLLLARGFSAVCVFVHDELSAPVLTALKKLGVGWVALRCAGFNNVDLNRASELGLRVVRVPAYSPHSVAEHTLALILALNRKIHRAYTRVREGNFALDGLMGFDLNGRCAGVVGTGKIGRCVADILLGFGCRVLAHDVHRDATLENKGVRYVELPELFAQSDIITLHCPLTPQTQRLINEQAVRQMKPNVMLINTSRGELVDTRAVIAGLKSGRIGYLGLDVYEEEEDLFFEDLSNRIIQDDVFSRLLTFPNVIITAHQAFFTHEAMTNIAHTTLQNLADLEAGRPCENEITADRVRR